MIKFRKKLKRLEEQSPERVEALFNSAHLRAKNHDWVELHKRLSNLAFMEERIIRYGSVYLLEDYELYRKDNLLLPYQNFVRRYSQLLNQYGDLLFYSLIRHVGLDQSTNEEWDKPWLQIIPMRLPNVDTNEAAALQFEIVAEFRKTSALSCLAVEANIGFFLESLGSIRIVNLDNGFQIPELLITREERPLLMICSSDGLNIGIFFEDGVAEIYRLTFEYDNDSPFALSRFSEPITFSYHVPDYDIPVATFIGATLYFQSSKHALEKVSIAIGNTKLLSDRIEGELSGLVNLDDGLFITERIGSDTRLIIFSKQEIQKELTKTKADVACICQLSENQVAVAYRSHQLAIYDLSEGIVETVSTRVKQIPKQIVWESNRLVWISENGTLHVWVPDQSNKHFDVSLGNRISDLYRSLNLIASRDGSQLTFSTITVTGWYKFTLSGGIGSKSYEVLHVFGTQTPMAYYAIAARHDQLYLIDGEKRNEIRLCETNIPIGIFAKNENSYLLGLVRDQCVLVHLPSQTVKHLRWEQSRITSIASCDQYGFWLVDSHGKIYFMDFEGRYSTVAHVSDTVLGYSKLVAGRRSLIWISTTVGQTVFGQDMIYRFNFYNYIPE